MRPFNKWHLAIFSKLAGIAEITLHTIQGPLPGHPISGNGRMTREQLLSNASVISTIILTEQLALLHDLFALYVGWHKKRLPYLVNLLKSVNRSIYGCLLEGTLERTM